MATWDPGRYKQVHCITAGGTQPMETDLDRLRTENEALRKRVAELEAELRSYKEDWLHANAEAILVRVQQAEAQLVNAREVLQETLECLEYLYARIHPDWDGHKVEAHSVIGKARAEVARAALGPFSKEPPP